MATILIVDDNEQFNLLMKSAMEIKGYDVETASNVKDAKALYMNKKYDVVITDIIMPGREPSQNQNSNQDQSAGGYEIILDLRRMGLGDRTIAVSGGGRTSAEDYLMAAQHFNVAAIFYKPVDIQALRAKVEEIIQNHKQ